jgi:sugar phosphate isomerase/epimerase
MAHAKELAPDTARWASSRLGHGILDWDFYLDSLRQIGFDGPLIMHGLKEEQVSAGTEFLRCKLERGRSRPPVALPPKHADEIVRAPEH